MEYERSWSVFSIIGFILSFFGLLAILGIVFSAIGISETTYGNKKGRGLAITGLIIGILMFSFSLITVLGTLIVLPMSGFFNPATIDQSIMNGQTKIAVSGIGFNKELSLDKNITLVIEGINNKIRIASNTNVSTARVSGINNELTMCKRDDQIVKRNGISNKVIYLNC
jgi:hypothetical protein